MYINTNRNISVKAGFTIKEFIEELGNYPDNMRIVIEKESDHYEEVCTTPRTLTEQDEEIEIVVVF